MNAREGVDVGSLGRVDQLGLVRRLGTAASNRVAPESWVVNAIQGRGLFWRSPT